MEKHLIHHIATGGTIDSVWDPSRDTAVPNNESTVTKYLDSVGLPSFDLSSEVACLEDSRNIGIELQDKIAAQVAASTHHRILVTAGTYLMPDIAKTIESALPPNSNKRILVTGARTPIKGYIQSDGGFNLGSGLAYLEEEDLQNPVCLGMNGQILDVAKGIRKDLPTVTFSQMGGGDVLGYQSFDLISAGGTIDFEYDGLDGLKPAQQSLVAKYLRDHVKIKREFAEINSVNKDGRALEAADWDLIIDSIRQSTSEHILITLGLFGMKKTQDYLEKNLGPIEEGRKIILTGAKTPLGLSDMTDATFNLGYALGKMAFVRQGIHIALNGMLFDKSTDHLKIIFTPQEQQKLQEMGVIQ